MLSRCFAAVRACVDFAYTAGVLVGAIDYYIFDKISRLSNSVPYGPVSRPCTKLCSNVVFLLLNTSVLTCSILQDNFKLGKKLAQGGFGTVYRADLVADNTAEPEPVIVKMVCPVSRSQHIYQW